MAEKTQAPNNKSVPPDRAHDPARSGLGETPIRTVRVDDATWSAAKRKSKASGGTMSKVMVTSLKHYVGK
jgi:hypothetical protein